MIDFISSNVGEYLLFLENGVYIRDSLEEMFPFRRC